MQVALEAIKQKNNMAGLTPGQIITKYQTSAPVDVVSIAKELGLNVWAMSSLPASVSGKIFRDALNGGATVSVLR